ncbi:MAG: putative chromosome-partitioning protein ParB [Chlamydiae bacterium]|nr:putative chromosome-partitioning protein ParB [Chlamydiota bacterium]
MSQNEKTATTEEIREVDISKISVNPYQPRRHFGKEEIEELADSIKSVGLIQPPVVRWCETRRYYELISGERRFRACHVAGLTKISVIVRDSDEFFSAEAALIENIQRVDLNSMEISRALQELKQFGLTQDDLAKRMGKKRSTIANYLRLLDLPIHVQQKLEQSEISMGHAKAILSIERKEDQESLCKLIISKGLSVRESENRANEETAPPPTQMIPPKVERDIHLDHVVEKFQQKLGTRVTAQGSSEKGKLCIDYYSLEDLERLMGIMGVEG